MHPARRRWFSFLTDWTIRLSRSEPDEASIQQQDYVGNTSRWRLRMTGFLRDRLRMRWLRPRK
jgi:hypothetical protein